MTKANPYLWPAHSSMTFRSAQGRIYFHSHNRRLDLADSLMNYARNRTVYLDFSTKAQEWEYWDVEKVNAIESLIRYNLGFDGYRVRIVRLLPVSDDYPCTSPFSWKLEIRST